jgi:hypothetical protein
VWRLSPGNAGPNRHGLRRLEQLIQEAVVTVPRALIAETINVIAVLSRDGKLIPLRTSNIDIRYLPKPYSVYHTDAVDDFVAILRAVRRVVGALKKIWVVGTILRGVLTLPFLYAPAAAMPGRARVGSLVPFLPAARYIGPSTCSA